LGGDAVSRERGDDQGGFPELTEQELSEEEAGWLARLEAEERRRRRRFWLAIPLVVLIGSVVVWLSASVALVFVGQQSTGFGSETGADVATWLRNTAGVAQTFTFGTVYLLGGLLLYQEVRKRFFPEPPFPPVPPDVDEELPAGSERSSH
jgi:hypothetical protein